ncbi:DNA-binding NarL/FixJ family response regulator [Actinoplanes octamycinicus]|uniref:DNA-binding NarL/FixJ family response regulator n=1 Tax=Actinoplanes octamycinicus TaxID=135948 RepID=A0A7W7GVC2_9ACTN|nr:response regulator transcription factor [Actinoplanes octamycinicus]MBB4738971.1 DNA-binding NarL/FixJ family response regulator [Actinoplanes octamycinicus]GIE60100.1 hypothetical protein Aoc01nite_55020 [Actinoplanes octamycinicus]
MSDGDPVRVLVVDDQQLIRDGIASLLDIQPGVTVVGTAPDGKAAISAAVQLQPDVVLMDIRMPRMDGVEAAAVLRRQAPLVKVIMLTTFDDEDYVVQALRAGAAGYLLKDLPAAELADAVRLAHAGVTPLDSSVAARLAASLSRPGDHPALSRPGDHFDPSRPTDRGDPSRPSDRGDPSRPGDRGDPSRPSDRGGPSRPGDRGGLPRPGDRGGAARPGDHGGLSRPGDRGTPSGLGGPGGLSRPGDHHVEPARQQAGDTLTAREIEVLRLVATGSTNREIAGHMFLSEGTVKNHISRILTRLGLRDRTQAAVYARDHGLLPRP